MALGKTVAALLEEVGSGELTEWMAYAGIEPFGAEIDDLRAGLMPALTINMHRDKDAPAASPMDFFPWHSKAPEPEPEPETPEEIARRIKSEVFGIKE